MLQRARIRLFNYLSANQDIPILGAVYRHHVRLPQTKSIVHQALRHLQELDLQPEQASKTVVKKRIAQQAFGQLRERPLQGQYWRRLASSGLNIDLTCRWLASPTLKRETEGFLIAAQEQMVQTNNFRAHISHSIPVDQDRCRRCKAPGETIDHVLGACPTLAPTLYVERHNRVVKYLHWSICRFSPVPGLAPSPASHHLEHSTALPSGGCLLWEVPIPTDLQVQANRPDLVLRTTGKVMLIDVSIPLDCNVGQKEEEKVRKYQPLAREIRRLWNLDHTPTVVPVVVGALGGLSDQLPSSLKSLCGPKCNAAVIQQQAILGSLNILRSVL